VDDVDATTDKVAAAGGSVMLPPMDVFDAGRMAVASDPTGAVISFWQAKQHQGFGRVREPGTYSWAELITDSPQRAGEFYAQVLDVSATKGPNDGWL
jgi:predicted enzyme related to lactoylglutathione lyase